MATPCGSLKRNDEVPQITIPRLPVTNFMPAEGEDFEVHAGITIPAIGVTAVVLSFVVPEGRHGMIKRIANVFVGGGFTDFSGALTWQIIQDANVPSVLVAPFFDNIVAALGSVNNPSTIDGIRIREAQLVQLRVTNVSVVVAGQLIGGRLGGYFYPVELDPERAGF